MRILPAGVSRSASPYPVMLRIIRSLRSLSATAPKRSKVTRARPWRASPGPDSVPQLPVQAKERAGDGKHTVGEILEVPADGEVLPAKKKPHRQDAGLDSAVPALVERDR